MKIRVRFDDTETVTFDIDAFIEAIDGRETDEVLRNAIVAWIDEAVTEKPYPRYRLEGPGNIIEQIVVAIRARQPA